jgi:hypothetical protein
MQLFLHVFQYVIRRKLRKGKCVKIFNTFYLELCRNSLQLKIIGDKVYLLKKLVQSP